MKQTSRIISIYSADTFGVCSALFELGGMVIMHDASGCNSTYTTHDEPRWYDMDSMIYISALTEIEAIMGDDEKMIGDIVDMAEDLQPRFIAIAGTPIPAMTGFDYTAVAELVEARTGIATFGFPTTGMNSYVSGASMAFEGIVRRLVKRNVEKTAGLSVNILGLTPLDYSVNGSDKSLIEFLEKEGFEIISKWAMGSTLEELAEAGRARVNLVVSSTGLGAAKALNEIFGTPYVVGVPFGNVMQKIISKELIEAAGIKTELLTTIEKEDAVKDCDNMICLQDATGKEIAIIGEGVISKSLAEAIEGYYGRRTKVLCGTEIEKKYLRDKDLVTLYEEDIIEALSDVEIVIADPLFRPICPEGVKFIPLPAESFSGRIYRHEIPELIYGFEKYFGNYF